ncbi:MAG: hypothetical protein AAGD11_18605 [Planctomycetota bacterium]
MILSHASSVARGADEGDATAQQPSVEVQPNALAELARSARDAHEPIDDQRLEAVRSRLRTASMRMFQRLGGDDSRLAAGWKTYLRWPFVEAHLADDVQITGQSLRDIDATLRRLRSNQPGLEHPVFVNTADELEQYRELAFWYALGQRRDTRPRYNNFLAELEKQITRNQEQPTVESTRQIGKIVGLIRQLGHSPEVADAVRQAFNQSNVLVEVSTAAMQAIAERPVTETLPVRDCILGATVRGTANSCGVLGVRPIPASDHAELELQLAGNIQSHTLSYKKPVRVRSTGSTDFVATKRVEVSDERFRLLPSIASARTKTQTRSVKKTGSKLGARLIERIARKKVAESKPQSEYIAARHTEDRINEKFDRQVRDALYEARQNYDRRLHPPLERIGMFPENLHMSSTSSSVQLQATLASYKQISTDRQPPGLRTGNDFSLRLHESAVNNFLPHLIAGATIGQASEDQPPTIEGDVPAWLKKLATNPKVKDQFVEQPAAADDEPRPPFRPWSFTLNNEHPVSVSFADGRVTLRIRIAQLKSSDDEDESINNWDFLVTYRVEQSGNQVILSREGLIEALPTGFDPQWFGDPRWGERLTGQQVGIRKNLEDNINKRVADGGGFPLEIPLPPVKLPTSGNATYELVLQQLECTDGWLTLGYRLPE